MQNQRAIMTEKRKYEKPSQRVIELQHQYHILAGSGVEANRSGYGTANEATWDEE
jgi:hypothetical protein